MKRPARLNPFLTASVLLHLVLLAAVGASPQARKRPPLRLCLEVRQEMPRPQTPPSPPVVSAAPRPPSPVSVGHPSSRPAKPSRTPVQPRQSARTVAYERNDPLPANSVSAPSPSVIDIARGPVGSGGGIPAAPPGHGAGLSLSAGPVDAGRMSAGEAEAGAGEESGVYGRPGSGEPSPYRLKKLVRSKAVPLVQPQPSYPKAARSRGLHGDVRVLLKIDSSGRVEPELLRTSGEALLDEAALATARRWRFKPARRGDEAVSDRLTVNFKFRLEEGE